MGGKQTKSDYNYSAGASAARCVYPQWLKKDINVEENEMDARLATGCRTPVSLLNNQVENNTQLVPIETNDRDSKTDNNSLNVLRKRFFKGFTYNLNDPRSPSLYHNRTPIVFEDTLEKSLNLDDTFADLFVESRLTGTVKEVGRVDVELEEAVDVDIQEEKEVEEGGEEGEEGGEVEVEVDGEEGEGKEEGSYVLTSVKRTPSPHTPLVLQQEFDPRSPSIGVERTPIIFSDDEVDETNEDDMLENILATMSLSLNSSDNSSVASITSINVKSDFSDKSDLHIVSSKPMNKHLDRVKGGKKICHRKPKRRLSRQQIYEDRENQSLSTPKLKAPQIDKNDLPNRKRTPLSCVRNRNGARSRSRSVDTSVKSMKNSVALTSFDDTLNLSENKSMNNLRIMRQDSQDSLES